MRHRLLSKGAKYWRGSNKYAKFYQKYTVNQGWSSSIAGIEKRLRRYMTNWANQISNNTTKIKSNKTAMVSKQRGSRHFGDKTHK